MWPERGEGMKNSFFINGLASFLMVSAMWAPVSPTWADEVISDDPSLNEVIPPSVDAAVTEAIVSDPVLMQEISEAIEENWPAIEKEAIEATGVENGDEVPATTQPSTGGDAPLIEVVETAPVPTADSATPAMERASRERIRWQRMFGLDFELGLPLSPGLTFTITPIRALTIGIGGASIGFTATAKVELTLNIIPIFVNSKWTPTVTVGYRYVYFTGLAEAIAANAGVTDLGVPGLDFGIKGMGMNMVTTFVGLERVGNKGFHFGLRAGRIMQVGDSFGRTDEDGVVLSNVQSYAALLILGRRF